MAVLPLTGATFTPPATTQLMHAMMRANPMRWPVTGAYLSLVLFAMCLY